MNTWIVDIETDGILRPEKGKRQLTKVHCAVARSGDETILFRPSNLSDLATLVRDADLIVGHNWQGFDQPALEHVYPDFPRPRQVFDTLVASRLMFPDLRDRDWREVRGGFPAKLVGKHSLKAWGYRLGLRKGDFAEEEGAFDQFTPELLEYCEQDVRVTAALYKTLQDKQWSEKSVAIEHAFALPISRMSHRGVAFDMDKAEVLARDLSAERAVLQTRLSENLGERVIEWVTPKKKLPRRKVLPVEVSSRKQVAEALISQFGWKPRQYTPEGRPKLDESVIATLDEERVPCKADLLRYYTIEKRLGQLLDGKQAWIEHAVKHDDHYRIHGFVNHNGAHTGRCTHSFPNLAQVPRVGTPWGEEFRSLFIPSPGMVMVGADMSGIEARMLGHYLKGYDKGKFIKRVLDGDVHEQNAKLIGRTRKEAKDTLYAVMYGAQGPKVGKMNGVSAEEGEELRQEILGVIPGLSTLIRDVQTAHKDRGYLVGLDKRRVHPRRAFAALNTLIQCGGAVVMKVATALMDQEPTPEGFLVLHVHDEYQYEARPENRNSVAAAAVLSITAAGEMLEVACPLTGDAKIGNSWAETH